MNLKWPATEGEGSRAEVGSRAARAVMFLIAVLMQI